jgi:hypothetical protein
MENLQIVLDLLESKRCYFTGNYFIPECWNSFGFKEFTTTNDRKKQINVNPYKFISEGIKACILGKETKKDLLKAVDGKVEITDCTIYSMLPRMFSAWNHYEDNLVSGSFLKAICLLPYLKKLNVNVIYLLPVFKYSDVNKKGEIGSPYSIKNVYSIDENLHDALLGDDITLLETEFKAFMEACHALGIRVMLDFVFRTVSRDNDLMVEHPDWFYWIPKEVESEFRAPILKGFNKPTVISPKSIKTMYSQNNIEQLEQYISLFRFSPNKEEPQKWQNLVKKHKETGENILKLIEDEFGITTAPGFSDVINDLQPPWSDATYLRLYFDNNPIAAKYVSGDRPPYILNDVAKASVSKGNKPNVELWEYIAQVMPYYQEKYGLDGARIDMGHALPDELNKDMINRVKRNNPNFILWSEEFNSKNSGIAKDNGYSFMTGGLWSTYPTIERAGFYKRLMSDLKDAKIPVSAAIETPDTPRGACLFDNRESLELMIGINSFIPNAVPFINNGQEIMEEQPMNMGLGYSEKGRFALAQDDPMYGKLAFFDNYMLHWTNDGFEFMERLMRDFRIIRENYKNLIKFENYYDITEQSSNRKILLFLYFDKNSKKGIFFLANRVKAGLARLCLKNLLPQEIDKFDIRVIYKEGKMCDEKLSSIYSMVLRPKEYIIGVLEK